MNAPFPVRTAPSTCPHDCPSACSLDLEIVGGRLGRVRGAQAQSYTAGVVCAKVARYAERANHPDRLLHPMRRAGPKGSCRFERIGWEEALDEIAERFLRIEREHGAQAIWPYHYAGTMGLVMRDGIERLANVKRYSGMQSTICVNTAWPGWLVGAGKLRGADPREMAKSDCVVIWGTNAVATQVNVMTHAIRARKERGAKIVVVDVYDTDTMRQADLALTVRPGTDAALACAVMHVLFRDGLADRDYMAKYADDPAGLEAHVASRTPDWAAAITGLAAARIEEFARLVGARKRSFFRLGDGFTRQRNGAAAMHAASCVPVVTGAWAHEGGGAFHSNSGIFGWDKTMIEGLDARDPEVRRLDQSRIGAVLTGETEALRGGPPVMALLVQNTNPACVAPDQEKVKRGLARDDLFTVVHEHFLTDTAAYADVVLPATMFHEHDDLYQGGGHQHVMPGAKACEAPGECRSNHDFLSALARRVGARHPGFDMSPRELADWTLRKSGHGTLDELEAKRWLDVQPDFRAAHFLDGFGHADGKFHFLADWASTPFSHEGPLGPFGGLPTLPDHWPVTEETDAERPYKLATSPARSFLNSSFNQTPGSAAREGGGPSVLIHADDAAGIGVEDGGRIALSNRRGAVTLRAKVSERVPRGTLVSEGLWPNSAFEDGRGINTLTGDDAPAPFGGDPVHDIAVAARPA